MPKLKTWALNGIKISRYHQDLFLAQLSFSTELNGKSKGLKPKCVCDFFFHEDGSGRCVPTIEKDFRCCTHKGESRAEICLIRLTLVDKICFVHLSS